MDCPKALRMVDAYADGELDVSAAIDLEEHFASCAECSWEYQRRIAVRTALATAARDERRRAPEGLAYRVRAAVRDAAREEAKAPAAPVPVASRRSDRRAWLAAAATLLVGALVGWSAARLARTPSASHDLGRELVASHVRSLMADHLTDVVSSDRHTVKPWFDGKIDFAPPVNDLADEGFALTGGRLDYVDGEPTAALVYERRRHPINVFVRPSPGSAPETTEVVNGYNVVGWTSGGMAFWAVSDLNAEELRQFAEALRARAASPTAP